MALPTPTPTPTPGSTPRAAVPPASAFGSVFTRPSPTSRGLGRCVSFRMGRGRKQTAAGPRAGACRRRGVGRRCLALWARGAAGVRGRRCLPCGQRRCRAARRIMACRGRERGFGTFCPSGKFTGAPGNGGTGRTPQGTEIHAISQTERAFSRQNLPHHPTAANAALYKARLIRVAENLPGARPRPAFRACLRPIRASYGFPTPVCGHSAPFTPSRARKSQLPTLPATASSPRPSRRENGGLCPHPPKGLIPWESLFGSHLYLSRLSAPKTPQADGPCSWAVRRVYALSPE